MEETVKPIYIEQLFKSKNPKLARWIPKFVYSFLKRVICQDQINDFISKYGDRKGLDFAEGILEYLDISYIIEGKENLPDQRTLYLCGQSRIGRTGWYHPDLFLGENI